MDGITDIAVVSFLKNDAMQRLPSHYSHGNHWAGYDASRGVESIITVEKTDNSQVRKIGLEYIQGRYFPYDFKYASVR